MQMAPERFTRSNYSFEEDLFMPLGVGVMYDERGTCNAVSVSRHLEADWEYDGYLLLSHPAREVREWAIARDPDLDPKYGFISKTLGLTMGADWIDVPDLDESELKEPAQAFVAFRPGYYEEEERRVKALNLDPEKWYSKNG